MSILDMSGIIVPDTNTRPVRSFQPDPNAAKETGPNGQSGMIEIYSSGRFGSVPGAMSSAALIVMVAGDVSVTHVHLEHEVKMVCPAGAPEGALTLYGDQLERFEWIRPPLGVKVIQPGVPHVAVYPVPDGFLGQPEQVPDLNVIEFKDAPVWRADTYPITSLHRLVVVRLHEMDLLGRVRLGEHYSRFVPEVTGGPR